LAYQTIDHDSLILRFASWKVMARLENQSYLKTNHLKTEDEGAMAFAITCFLPDKAAYGSCLGWIGTGSNRFCVERVEAVGGAVFHLGRVTSGGFHESKPNLTMWHEAYTPDLKAEDEEARSQGILVRRYRDGSRRPN
jgi:hypothetical protein